MRNHWLARTCGWHLVAVLVLAALATVVGCYFTVHKQEREHNLAARERLKGLADLKESQISQWYQTQREDAEMVLENALITGPMRRFLTNGGDPSGHQELLEWMEARRRVRDYAAVALLDAQGKVRMSAPPGFALGDGPCAGYLQNALGAKGVVAVDLHRDGSNGAPHLGFWIPIRRAPKPANGAEGALLLQVDPQRFLYPLTGGWPGGSTETLLVRPEGEAVVFLSELKYASNATLVLRRPLEAEDSPEAQAARGMSGIVEGRDYRGLAVLADVRPVTGAPWRLVTKIDRTEIDAELQPRIRSTVALAATLLLAVSLAIAGLWHLRHLESARELVAAQADLRAHREHLEELVARRTKELEDLNRRLTAEIRESGRTEAALRESEEKYRSLFDQSIDAVLLTVPNGRILTANPEACQVFGMSEEELCQVSRAGVVDATDPRLPEALAERARTGRFKGELTLVRRDGSKFPAEISTVIYKDKYGLEKTSMIVRDITDRKRAEEALERSRAELRAIYEHAPVLMCTLDAQRRVLYANRAFTDFTGVAESELRAGRACGVFGCINALEDPRGCGFGTDCANCALRLAIEDTMESGQSHRDVEYRAILERQGRRQEVVMLGATSLIQAADQPVLLLCLIDITDRKRAEAETLEARRELERFFALVPDMVCVATPDGFFKRVNPAWTESLGLTTDELKSRPLTEFIHPEDREATFREVERQLAGQRTAGFANRYRCKDGSYRWLEWYTTPAIDGLLYAAARDVTERRQAEESLRQLSGQLLRMQDEERRRLARELHDTTAQKLAMLLFNLKRLVRQAPDLEAEAQESLGECRELAEQCAGELRTFSYLLHPPLLEELGLAGAVRDYADGFARRSGLRVDLEVAAELPRLPRERELALFRVLQESLANVHRHSGSKTVSILVTSTGVEVRLAVRDAGCGMELKADPVSGEIGPSKLGVGLAGMRERLRQLGGRLEIESAGGTTVTAILPLQES